jgi:sec-independent protein translocase protein TatA
MSSPIRNEALMPHVGPMEIAIVLVIALLVLGPKRLPAAGRSLGSGIREFRDGIAARGQDSAAEQPGPLAVERDAV